VVFVYGVTNAATPTQILTKRPGACLAFFDCWVKTNRYDDERIMDYWPKGLSGRPAHGGAGWFNDNCGPVGPYENVWAWW